MITVVCLLALAGVIMTLASAATGRVPLWVAVLVLGLAQVLYCIPLR